MSDPNTLPDGSAPTATMSPQAGQLGGMLAPLRDTALAPLQPPPVSPTARDAADPLAGGIDYRRLWHSFRRCWLPASALALLLAALGGVATVPSPPSMNTRRKSPEAVERMIVLRPATVPAVVAKPQPPHAFAEAILRSRAPSPRT